jgi:ABC-2 type transport system permease protein
VSGITPGDFAAYFTIVMIVNQLTFSWHFWFFEWRVRNGFFSPLLLRPVHPIHQDIAENLTFKALTFTVVAPVALFLVASFGATFHTEPWHLLAFVPALALAMALRFVVEWTLAGAAFWITRTTALNQAYTVVLFFLSGLVAPLQLLPPVVQLAATILPFRWMIAFPVDVALGRVAPSDVALGFGAQLAWIAIALLVLRVTWTAGTRRYSAVGA